jgi:hypothetical protein
MEPTMINNPSQLLTLNAADRQHQLEREAALWHHTTPTRAVRSQRQSRIWIVIKDTPARIHAASARWLVTARRTRSSTVS